jgi:hypothetical protein
MGMTTIRCEGSDAMGRKSLPCLGGEVLDCFGDFDVAREPSVEAMMSIERCSGAASSGAVAGDWWYECGMIQCLEEGRKLGMRSPAESVTKLAATLWAAALRFFAWLRTADGTCKL